MCRPSGGTFFMWTFSVRLDGIKTAPHTVRGGLIIVIDLYFLLVEHLSTRYTNPWYWIPLLVVRPTSQVRLLE